MAWTPYISNYKSFYIQTSEDPEAWGTEVYGLIAKSNPYPLLLNPKTPYKNDWKDENGDDEYVEVQHYKSQELEVKFYCKVQDGATSARTLRRQIAEFFEKIKQGAFSVYDDYTGIGFRNVRYAGYSEDSFTAWDNYAKAVFTIKLKVNDPVTRMKYDSLTGTIVEDTSPWDGTAWIPFIRDYKPFYIQAEDDETAWGTESLGLIAKANPYPVIPSPKNPYANDWKDEDGEDEFVTVQHFQSQEIDVKFFCKTKGIDSHKNLRRQIWEFFSRIRNGEFSIYDAHTGIGRRNVRYAGFKEDSFDADDNYTQTVFTVKFKINDPVTPMRYDQRTGKIVEDIGMRDDLLGTESGSYIITESGLYIQVK